MELIVKTILHHRHNASL